MPTEDTKGRLRRLARGSRNGLLTTARAAELLGISTLTAPLVLGRLARSGWLARVRRGLYLVLPLEADRETGAVEDPWVLARELFSPCYIGGWTAAEHWGLTEQLFRSTFVVTAATTRDSSPAFLGSEFHIVRSSTSRVAGVASIWRGREKVAISDRERTIADAFAAPGWVGGIRHLTQILRAYRSSAEWSPERLVARVAETGSGAAFKRLGFLTEIVLGGDPYIVERALARRTTGVIRLDPGIPGRGSLSTRWRLWKNAGLDEGEAT
jgi:predicted transcriptional regulator of viral defense system